MHDGAPGDSPIVLPYLMGPIQRSLVTWSHANIFFVVKWNCRLVVDRNSFRLKKNYYKLKIIIIIITITIFHNHRLVSLMVSGLVINQV